MDLEAERDEIAPHLLHRRLVEVQHAQTVDPEHGPHRERLELGLRARPDQGVDAGAGQGELARGERRRRCGAQRGQQRHLGEEDRVAVVDVGEHAEARHGLQPAGGVVRVAVDVLEGVQRSVAGRHQLDHPVRAVAGQSRDLLELLPAQQVGLQVSHHPREDVLDAVASDPADRPGDVEQVRHGPLLSVGASSRRSEGRSHSQGRRGPGPGGGGAAAPPPPGPVSRCPAQYSMTTRPSIFPSLISPKIWLMSSSERRE